MEIRERGKNDVKVENGQIVGQIVEMDPKYLTDTLDFSDSQVSLRIV